MQIKLHEIKKFKLESINFYLLYGENSGLIDETINKIFKSKFSKNIINFDEAEILNKIDAFNEILFNKSFFDNDKLIIIKRASDKILSLIKEVIEKNPVDVKVIIICGKLEKKSKLRNFFEKNKKIATIPFYEDNYQSLFLLAEKFLKEKKIKISNENINLIVLRSKGDRINLTNELEKISSFSKNRQIIKFEDIAKLTNLAENFSVSELVDCCLTKNKRKTLDIFNENNLNENDNVVIIKSFLYKLKRLKIIKDQLGTNKNMDQVFSLIKPPIFWKDKEIIKQQLKNWSSSEIDKIIKKINQLEIIIKKNPNTSNFIIGNFIFENLVKTNSSL